MTVGLADGHNFPVFYLKNAYYSKILQNSNNFVNILTCIERDFVVKYMCRLKRTSKKFIFEEKKK